MSNEFFNKKPNINPTIFGVTDDTHIGECKLCYAFSNTQIDDANSQNNNQKLLFSTTAFRRDGSLVTLEEVFEVLKNKGHNREIEAHGTLTNWIKYDASVSYGSTIFDIAINTAKQSTTHTSANNTATNDDYVQKVLLTYELPPKLKTKLQEIDCDYNKFFNATGDGDNAKFLQVEPIQMLLDFIGGELEQDQNKLDKTRLPLGDTRLRELLNHIVFIMPNKSACDALYNLIRKTPNNDPNIQTANDWIKRRFTIIRGYNSQGKFDNQELEYVRMAMNGEVSNKGQHANERQDCLHSRTLTITCDDLTITNNPKEWNGLFVFRNFDNFNELSEQFLAINKPWIVGDNNGNRESIKQECFVFDFSLDKTLKQIEQLSQKSVYCEGESTAYKINQYLNFFDMKSINSATVEHIPLNVFAYDGVQTKRLNGQDIVNLISLGTQASSTARKWEIEQIAKSKKGYTIAKFKKTFEYKLIYVIRINDNAHEGLLKIGDATIDDIDDLAQLIDNSPMLQSAANKRIKQYTQTAGIAYDLLYTTLAIRDNGDAFRDYDIHNVLKRSGIENIYPNQNDNGNANEWYKVDLSSAKNAIIATKLGKQSLDSTQVTNSKNPIVFRPEQLDAINLCKRLFSKREKDGTRTILGAESRCLWNAKMRFGKTLTALQVAKELNFKKTIIVTHRPVVSDSWIKDFDKIFYDNNNFEVGSKTSRKTITELLIHEKNGGHIVYFASIQDLRGSEAVGGKFDKNNEIFNIEWDYLIIDEAHEGTQTHLGDEVIKLLNKSNTKLLYLSGTPFNLISGYKEDEIFTWDYVMEQRAKQEWNNTCFGDSNPYESLPTLNIFTYDLNKSIAGFESIDDNAFNFKEFFRVWTGDIDRDKKPIPVTASLGDFVHHEHINNFLNLLIKEGEHNYPFSTQEYRDNFRHSLWMLPGVKEARAMSTLLKKHSVFGVGGGFEIVNVAGDGDEEADRENALKMVERAISTNPQDTRTITLSCGRLTTGVTVPAWTAVFMLAGSYSTSASSYLQTIFRVQSPCPCNSIISNRIKTNAFVFDFAPDRTLSMVAEAVSLNTKNGNNDTKKLGEFLNFCPVVGIDGSNMKPYSVDNMLSQLKKAMTDRVVKNGFDDPKLYDNNRLGNITQEQMSVFEGLKEIISKGKTDKPINKIEVNKTGLDNEYYEVIGNEDGDKPKKLELSEEEKEAKKELEEKRKRRNIARDTMRSISIRIPLLVYGAEIDNEEEGISVENFVNLVDDRSWIEFMPKGVTKEIFNNFAQFYDSTVFIDAGKRIRAKAKFADTLSIEERINILADIFSTFKNPDKETVLTPWRVVNLHLGDTIGGYNLYEQDKNTRIDIEGGKKPRLIEHAEITEEVFTPNTKILELNSKTGLYPLYAAYSCLQYMHAKYNKTKSSDSLYQEILDNNIFVITRTQMAKMITNRTLRGFKDYKTNIMVYEDIIQDMKDDVLSQKTKNKTQRTIDEITNPKKWNKVGEQMKFNTVIGNPPYQENFEHREEQPPVYHLFYDIAHALGQKATLITPARFLWKVGKTPTEWNEKMLSDIHFKIQSNWCYMKSTDIFESVDIKGGVAYGYFDRAKDFGAIGAFSHNSEVKDIMQKVVGVMGYGLDSIMYSASTYKYNDLFVKDNPHLQAKVSVAKERRFNSDIFDLFSEVFYDTQPNDGDEYIQIYGRQNNERCYKWFKRKWVNEPQNFAKYKVIVPASNGSGALGEVLSTPLIGEPLIGEPLIGVNYTFITFGSMDTRQEAENLLKYIKTKFARMMLGTKKVTQGNKTKEVWSNVPLQNFKPDSDIDWNQSIENIDIQLFKKYKMTMEQIEFVEKSITTMSDGNTSRQIEFDFEMNTHQETLADIFYTSVGYKYTEIFFEENKGFAERGSGGSMKYIHSAAFDRFPEVFLDKEPNDGRKYAKILGRQNNERTWKYLDTRYIIPPKNFEGYKVFVPSSNGSGALGEVLSTPMIGLPMQGHSQTFISFGNYDNELEANNLLKYIKTKFARMMLGTKKVTQGNDTKEVWSNVPLQNFKPDSDIDWSKSIADIDQQLYAKYKLTKKQIEFVEKSITTMSDGNTSGQFEFDFEINIEPQMLDSIMYTNTGYKYTELFFKENRGFEDRVSGGSKRYLHSAVFDVFPEVFFKDKPNDGQEYVKILGRQNNERTFYYFNLKYLNPPANFKSHKVIVPASNGSGALGEVLSTPMIGNPELGVGIGHTETFITFGNFDNELEASNLLKYIKTKFARMMLGTKKVTQGNKTKEVWSNVPLQNFKPDSDIDWSKSIADIDQQLYAKYKFDKTQIEFVERSITEMK